MRIVPLVAFVLLASNGAARAADLRQRLLNNERRLWTAWQAHDPEPFRRSLTQDTTQIVTGIGAIEGREAVAKSMASHSCTLAGFRLSNGSLRMLGGAVAMLSYFRSTEWPMWKNATASEVASYRHLCARGSVMARCELSGDARQLDQRECPLSIAAVSPSVRLAQLAGGGNMHVHLPKPLHGWRAFVGEVGIIVHGSSRWRSAAGRGLGVAAEGRDRPQGTRRRTCERSRTLGDRSREYLLHPVLPRPPRTMG